MHIVIDNVTKVFRVEKETVRALDRVSCEFESGRIYGLVGRNGSGKTMLMKVILGLVRPTEGKVLFDGKTSEHPDNVGAIIENPGFLTEYTGFRNLKLLSMLTGKIHDEEIRNAMELCGLDPRSRKKVSAYSMGMRQRLGLAQAIMEDPEILLLDEPFSGLDDSGVEDMYGLCREMKRQGKLLIIASHSKEDIAALCDEVFYMQKGQLKREREQQHFS